MVRSPYIDSKGMKKGAWSEDEDNKLSSFVQKHGHANWRLVPKYAGLARCGKSCRLRWINYLKPGIKRGNFSKEEQDLVIKLHSLLGNKWSAIAAKLPGRTDNEIKNFWHTHMDKHRRRQNRSAKKVTPMNANQDSSNYRDEVFDEIKPFEITQCQTTYENKSILSFDISPSSQQLPNVTQFQQVDSSWSKASDTKRDGQNDDCFPPLQPEEEFFYPKFQYYSGFSSSDDSSSYLSGALDWIGDDNHSFISSEYVASLVQGSLWSTESSSLPQEEVGGLMYDDPMLHYYFDHGINGLI